MKPTLYVIDTSVFVAFYLESDVNHPHAIDIMRGLVGDRIIVHPYVIQEAATVLTYKSGTKLAKHFVADVRNGPNIIISPVDAKKDMDHFSISNKKISFTDIALISLANELSATLLTFDKQMISSFKRKLSRK